MNLIVKTLHLIIDDSHTIIIAVRLELIHMKQYYMFNRARSFNQDLCPWKDTLDAVSNKDGFCTNGAECIYPDC